MKLSALAALLPFVALAAAHEGHANHARLAKRQAASSSASTSAAASSSSAAASSSAASASSPASTGATSTSAAASGSSTTAAASGTAAAAASTVTGMTTFPLSELTSGMVSQATMSLTTTYSPGATPPIQGAPALPTAFVFNSADWPAQDKVPDTSSDEVQQWLKELDGFDIPDWDPTVDGTCASDPTSSGEAKDRGWWTCGGYTRETDIVACPDPLTWGVSFDDGPGPYTQELLDYLNTENLLATFFVVGSRVIERPSVLIEEYMTGNEISVHTWSHPHLTSLTTEEIVAELGWTRKAIQTVLGVTPTTMRPPYGDIDDRVRAISLAMGMVPIIWTRTDEAGQFDTNDWKVAGGLVTGPDSFATFEAILGNASTMDTGFIVLEHDLYAVTVDLAIGYTLSAALTHDPAFTIKPIGNCSKIPATNMYAETNTNTSFPYSNSTSSAASVSSNSGNSSSSSNSTSGALPAVLGGASGVVGLAVGVVVAGMHAMFV